MNSATAVHLTRTRSEVASLSEPRGRRFPPYAGPLEADLLYTTLGSTLE